jgi:hypothetical protein
MESTAATNVAPVPEAEGKVEQNITPWEVESGESGIDYNKLIDQFGCTPIDEALLQRMERVTGKPVHPWLKRGLFFSHRYQPILNYFLVSFLLAD